MAITGFIYYPAMQPPQNGAGTAFLVMSFCLADHFSDQLQAFLLGHFFFSSGIALVLFSGPAWQVTGNDITDKYGKCAYQQLNKNSSGWLTAAVLDAHITDRPPMIFLLHPFPSRDVREKQV